MLSPDYILNAPREVIELMQKMENDILQEIAMRIAKHEKITPSTVYQYDILADLGSTQDSLQKIVAKNLDVTQEEAISLIKEAGLETYRDDASAFASGGKDLMPYYRNGKIQSIVHAVEFQTLGEFKNLGQSIGFAGTGGNWIPLRQIYIKTLDEMALENASGVVSQSSATRKAVKRLAKSGIQVVNFESGAKRHIDGHIRTVLRTSLGQLSNRISEQNIFDMGQCYVEVSAHMGARPSHADWQGKIYYWSEMDRTGDNNKHNYPDFIESTEYGTGRGLGGWNCRHSFFPFFPEISERAYTDKELEEYASQKVKYNGKEMAYYEATQKQRYLEREIRRSKREIKMFEAMQDKEMITANKARLYGLYEAYADFSKQTNIRRKGDRLFTP